MAWFGDLSDRLLVDQVVSDTLVEALSRLEVWDMARDLIVQLVVAAAAVDSGDTLVVLVQHSLDREVRTTGVLSL
jgi:hypothetical protein